jgi:hypothetical protein
MIDELFSIYDEFQKIRCRNMEINPYNPATRQKHVLWVNISVVDKGIINLL